MTISPGPGMGIAQYLGHAIPFSLQAFGDGTRHLMPEHERTGVRS